MFKNIMKNATGAIVSLAIGFTMAVFSFIWTLISVSETLSTDAYNVWWRVQFHIGFGNARLLEAVTIIALGLGFSVAVFIIIKNWKTLTRIPKFGKVKA